jgi:Raf kinase inhibitor-like YbhB/YbcL family protein
MRRFPSLSAFLLTCALPLAAVAAPVVPPARLDVQWQGLGASGVISPANAFCVRDAKTHSKPAGQNRNPGVVWRGAPASTRSYVVLMSDPDVPASFEKAGKEGQSIGADDPRQTFYHWVLFDIPGAKHGIPAKAGNTEGYGISGKNDLGPYHAKNPKSGVDLGYDGPCPPWNDERAHHYHIRVFALDIEHLGLDKNATAKQVEKALQPHLLAEGETVGVYRLNETAR